LHGLVDTLAIGVDRVQRQFEPMAATIDAWQNHNLPDVEAKNIIYDAFVLDGVDAPKHLMRPVHQAYFEPPHAEFEPRTAWSLQNAFTHAFKALDPIPQFRATASLGEFFANIQ
jgi:hypothetical protein